MDTAVNLERTIKPNNDQLIVELVGLAGTGKTTLSEALAQRNEHIIFGQYLQFKKFEHFPLFLRYIPSLFPSIVLCSRRERRLTWDEIKGIIYLTGGEQIISQQVNRKETIVLLDQGPIFQLATLNAFGPECLKDQRFESWWQKLYRHWASILDFIIWLDAPDNVLKERIDNRVKKHLYKNSSEDEIYKYLADYRLSYKHIIEEVGHDGKTKLYEFDTSQVTIEEIVEKVSERFFLGLERKQNLSIQHL